jgi:hypothetical protein
MTFSALINTKGYRFWRQTLQTLVEKLDPCLGSTLFAQNKSNLALFQSKICSIIKIK